MAARRCGQALAWLVAFALGGASSALAATVTIVNLDPPGQGLNDPTPVAPVGGNSATTRGGQRLAVFQQAASIWGAALPASPVSIAVEASFTPLSCDAISGVLGGAGPNDYLWDFPNAPFAQTVYSKAQANRLAGFDVDPGINDIGSVFNSNLGTPGCLEAFSWYYGFDHNEAANQIDFLTVVLHEMGHGLGFLTVVDDDTGDNFFGIPDIYSRFILDQKTGLHWNEETSAQRAASDTATYRVVWDGSFTRSQASSTLGPRPLLQVNTPAAIAGEKYVGVATFGTPLSSPGVTGNVVLGIDGTAPTGDGCQALTNGAQVAGKVALVDRGACPFATKVKNCQNAGAIAAIVVNDVAGTDPVGMSGVDPSITIPSVRITKQDGDAIKAQLGVSVNVTLRVDPTRLAGADASGHPMLYAPNPNAPGSSISHWDVSCGPNLLMEPNINADLTSNLDLTLTAFKDIGWFPGTTGVDASALPGAIALRQNVPNPFRTSTLVAFELTHSAVADLGVFDVSGRRVKRLLHRVMPAGRHETIWDGTNDQGNRVGEGVYFTRLITPEGERSRSLLIVR